MLSDTLFDSLAEIRKYQADFPEVYDKMRDIIDDVARRMDKLRTALDDPADDAIEKRYPKEERKPANGKSEYELKVEARGKVKYNPGDILWDADIEQHGVVVAQHETVIVYRGQGSEKVGAGMVGQYIEVCDLIARAGGPSFSGSRFVIEEGARVKAVPCGWDKDQPLEGTVYEVCDLGCWVHFDDGELVDGDGTGKDGWRIRPCMWENIRPLLDHGLDVYNEAMAKKNAEAA